MGIQFRLSKKATDYLIDKYGEVHCYAMKGRFRDVFVCFLLVCVSIVAFVSCRSPEDSRNARLKDSTTPSEIQTNNDANTIATKRPDSPPKLVVKRTGWFKFDVRQGTVKRPRTELTSDEGVFFTTFTLSQPVLLKLSCNKSNANPKSGDECERYPFDTEWLVQQVTVFDKRNKPFLYEISAARQLEDRTGGIGLFSFYDEDGDGVFETFCLCDTFDEFHVPTWLD